MKKEAVKDKLNEPLKKQATFTNYPADGFNSITPTWDASKNK